MRSNNCQFITKLALVIFSLKTTLESRRRQIIFRMCKVYLRKSCLACYILSKTRWYDDYQGYLNFITGDTYDLEAKQNLSLWKVKSSWSKNKSHINPDFYRDNKRSIQMYSWIFCLICSTAMSMCDNISPIILVLVSSPPNNKTSFLVLMEVIQSFFVKKEK